MRATRPREPGLLAANAASMRRTAPNPATYRAAASDDLREPASWGSALSERRLDAWMAGFASVTFMDMKLEVVPIPVRSIDAAKDFYTQQVGFNLDHDVRPSENMRIVQMTPPGSACSVVIGEGLPLGEPGSVKGVQLVVEDLDAVRNELAGRGVGISEVQQMGPEGTPGSRYCFFEDPDGNMWAIQEYKRT
jgi:catechol 2,3-dioxygenase-like lactoylglutathione lyase family enzyme